AILHAFHIALKPMAFELSQTLIQAGAGELHLIERLDGGKPGCAARIGLAAIAAPVRAAGYVVAGHHAISRPAFPPAASIQPSRARHALHRRLCPALAGAPAPKPAPHCPP